MWHQSWVPGFSQHQLCDDQLSLKAREDVAGAAEVLDMNNKGIHRDPGLGLLWQCNLGLQ